MSATPDGWYLDPRDPEIYREWMAGQWTANTRTGPGAPVVVQQAPHVGSTNPSPQSGIVATDPSAGAPARVANDNAGSGALVLAVVWLIVSAIVGGIFVFGTESVEYGGDAYTGIQNTSAQTVRALGVLIFGTGVVGLITALSRRR